jgi:RNA polymerase sigma-32 factor
MGQVSEIHRTVLKAASSAPYLERNEEQLLARQWLETRNEAALHKLTQAHMRLVIAVASRFRNYGLSMADVVQEGHIGLLEAAARFEPARDVRFSTYATWWIRAAIQDFILRNWSIVRGGTSSAQKSLFFNLRRLRARISQAGNGEKPMHEIYDEIARAVGVSTIDVRTMAARMSSNDISLNAPVAEGDDESAQERGDFLVDTNPLPDEILIDHMDGDRRMSSLRAAMQMLNPREFAILQERRLQEEGATLEAIGSKMGISKERVRQIENRALSKLRQALVARDPDMFGALNA